MTTTWLYVVMVCVATHRATRLVTRDDFPPILWLREGVIGWAHGFGWAPRSRWKDADYDHYRRWHWLADLITCPWCAGVWLAAGITWLADRLVTDGLPGPLLVWATAAAVAGWLGRADDTGGDGGDGEAAFNRSHNTTPPQRTDQRPVVERMPTKQMHITSRDALITLGTVMLSVGLVLVLGWGLALILSGAIVFGLGMLRTPARSESIADRVRKAA